MTPKANRRSATLTHIVTALLVASTLHGATANAASFQYRHPIMGLVASPTAQAQQAATEILVALTSGPTLPAGEVNWPYSYDLKQLLSVTGDPSYNASNVSWELQSGTLPAGLSLGTDGVLSGVPTTKDTVGSSFQVKATYKTKTGQQAYTIVVNGAVLHVTQISAGALHTCAVTTTGGVKCWGSNAYGQLGNNSSVNSYVPVAVVGLDTGVASISMGGTHSCALTTSAGIKCWGRDNYGQLGNDTALTNRPTPVDVQGLTSGVVRIAAGYEYTCAVTTSGDAKCWGFNADGQVGDGSTSNRALPVSVGGLPVGVKHISAGQVHTCAITTTGSAVCWGNNGYGQLGNNSTANSSVPVTVSGLTTGVAGISVGTYHTCAVLTSGGGKCWGYNSFGQVGDGTTNSPRLTPTAVSGFATSGIATIATGYAHTCAITTSGGAKCWGYNSYGQVGDGTLTNRVTPVDVSGFTSGVLSITGGNGHTCLLSQAGPMCWGRNDKGQVGDNSTTFRSTPVAVLP